jgi:hypothetical protein
VSPAKALSTLQVLAFAWRSSGGFRELVRSFDFWLALAVCVLASPFWVTDKWPDQVISVLPNLLGFTLGGFAIFLGFGSDEFKGAIANADEDVSPYMSVSAAFITFMAFQLAALMWALVARALYFETPKALAPWAKEIAWASYAGGAVGYFLFAYSLALVLRAAVRIFRLSRWYNMYLTQVTQTGQPGADSGAPKSGEPLH